MVYLEDLRTCNSWCCCVGLRLGCILTSVLSTIVYIVLAFSHMLDISPNNCWMITVAVACTNTILIVGAIQENHKVLKTYLWMAFWLWTFKVFLVLGMLLGTKFYGDDGQMSVYIWYLFILCIDVYFWSCANSYYVLLLKENEDFEPTSV